MPQEPNDLKVSVTEKLADTDKMALESVKVKAELALERAKTAVSQSESAKLIYDNVILQLAMKYKLTDGDTIDDTGEIKRVSKEKAQ